MKKLIALICISAAAACAGAPSAERAANEAAQLSAALEGYEQAGPPESCIEQRRLGSNRSAGGAIIFSRDIGSDIWVNNPPGGCPDLSFGRALITRTPSTRLCRGDIAIVFDPVSKQEYGGCGLGDFTPYRRTAQR